MLPVFRKVVNLVMCNDFMYFCVIMCFKIKSSWYFEQLNLLMKNKQGSLYFFNDYQLSHFL